MCAELLSIFDYESQKYSVFHSNPESICLEASVIGIDKTEETSKEYSAERRNYISTIQSYQTFFEFNPLRLNKFATLPSFLLNKEEAKEKQKLLSQNISLLKNYQVSELLQICLSLKYVCNDTSSTAFKTIYGRLQRIFFPICKKENISLFVLKKNQNESRKYSSMEMDSLRFEPVPFSSELVQDGEFILEIDRLITKEVLYTLKKLEPFFLLFRIGRLRMKHSFTYKEPPELVFHPQLPLMFPYLHDVVVVCTEQEEKTTSVPSFYSQSTVSFQYSRRRLNQPVVYQENMNYYVSSICINSYKPSPQFISFFLHNNIIRSIDQIIILPMENLLFDAFCDCIRDHYFPSLEKLIFSYDILAKSAETISLLLNYYIKHSVTTLDCSFTSYYDKRIVMNMNDIFQYIRDQPYPKLHILNLSYSYDCASLFSEFFCMFKCAYDEGALKLFDTFILQNFFSTSQCLEVALYLVTHRQESTPLTIDISDLKVQSEHKQSLLALLQSDAYVIANNVQYYSMLPSDTAEIIRAILKNKEDHSHQSVDESAKKKKEEEVTMKLLQQIQAQTEKAEPDPTLPYILQYVNGEKKEEQEHWSDLDLDLDVEDDTSCQQRSEHQVRNVLETMKMPFLPIQQNSFHNNLEESQQLCIRADDKKNIVEIKKSFQELMKTDETSPFVHFTDSESESWTLENGISVDSQLDDDGHARMEEQKTELATSPTQANTGKEKHEESSDSQEEETPELIERKKSISYLVHDFTGENTEPLGEVLSVRPIQELPHHHTVPPFDVSSCYLDESPLHFDMNSPIEAKEDAEDEDVPDVGSDISDFSDLDEESMSCLTLDNQVSLVEDSKFWTAEETFLKPTEKEIRLKPCVPKEEEVQNQLEYIMKNQYDMYPNYVIMSLLQKGPIQAIISRHAQRVIEYTYDEKELIQLVYDYLKSEQKRIDKSKDIHIKQQDQKKEVDKVKISTVTLSTSPVVSGEKIVELKAPDHYTVNYLKNAYFELIYQDPESYFQNQIIVPNELKPIIHSYYKRQMQLKEGYKQQDYKEQLSNKKMSLLALTNKVIIKEEENSESMNKLDTLNQTVDILCNVFKVDSIQSDSFLKSRLLSLNFGNELDHEEFQFYFSQFLGMDEHSKLNIKISLDELEKRFVSFLLQPETDLESFPWYFAAFYSYKIFLSSKEKLILEFFETLPDENAYKKREPIDPSVCMEKLTLSDMLSDGKKKIGDLLFLKELKDATEIYPAFLEQMFVSYNETAHYVSMAKQNSEDREKNRTAYFEFLILALFYLTTVQQYKEVIHILETKPVGYVCILFDLIFRIEQTVLMKMKEQNLVIVMENNDNDVEEKALAMEEEKKEEKKKETLKPIQFKLADHISTEFIPSSIFLEQLPKLSYSSTIQSDEDSTKTKSMEEFQNRKKAILREEFKKNFKKKVLRRK